MMADNEKLEAHGNAVGLEFKISLKFGMKALGDIVRRI